MPKAQKKCEFRRITYRYRPCCLNLAHMSQEVRTPEINKTHRPRQNPWQPHSHGDRSQRYIGPAHHAIIVSRQRSTTAELATCTSLQGMLTLQPS